MGILADTSHYFSWSQLLSYNCVYNAAIGGRGIGKTYDAIRRTIKYSIKHNSEFIYLRRYREELSTAKANLFNEMIDEFPEHEFRVNGMIGEYKRKQAKEWKTLCYFVALSTTQANKSVSYPRVKWIIFDEFIIEKGLIHYLPNETVVFDNFYSTVDRWKDKTKVLFAANSIAIDNPYFINWDINPDQSEYIIKRGGFLGVQIVDSDLFMNRVQSTRFAQYIMGSEYAEFAMGNKFKDNNKDLIAPRHPKAEYHFSLKLENIDVSLWRAPAGPWFVEESQPKEPVFCTFNVNMVSENVTLLLRNDKITQTLKTQFRYGRMFFDSPKTRNSMRELFKG